MYQVRFYLMIAVEVNVDFGVTFFVTLPITLACPIFTEEVPCPLFPLVQKTPSSKVQLEFRLCYFSNEIFSGVLMC
jgi:hypothetical protein